MRSNTKSVHIDPSLNFHEKLHEKNEEHQKVGLSCFMKNLFTKREVLTNNFHNYQNDSMLNISLLNEFPGSRKSIDFLPFFNEKKMAII